MTERAARALRRAHIALFVAALLLALTGTFTLSLLLTRPVRAQDTAADGYVVQPGDTLGQIASRFGTTLDALAAANGITNPDLIAVGQVLLIPGVTTHPLVSGVDIGLVRALPGDTIASVSARYGQDPALIAALNALTLTDVLFPGRSVYLPTDAVPEEPLRFGAIDAITYDHSIEQGRTGRITVRSSRPIALSVLWNGLPITLAPLDAADNQVAMLPVPALLDVGPYPLTVSYTTRDGVVVTDTLQVQVVDGGYEQQVISVPSDRTDLLDPARVQAEEATVNAALATFTPDMVLRAPFIRPISSAYETTSPFGTRRYYDSGPNSYNGYHAGQDFGAGVGVTVTAPATGVVALAQPLDTRGNALIIDHGRGVYTGLWHLSQFLVSPGQLVLPGQPVGLVGNTGLSTGAHLHWELRIFGIAVDPMQFLNQPVFPPPAASP